jgi:hypothetical protein
MLARGNLGIERRRMTLTASRRIVSHRRISARDLMRIVTRLTRHRTVTFQKALGLPQPVRGASDNFEFIVMSRTSGMVEDQQEIAQRFSGHEGEWPSIEAAD